MRLRFPRPRNVTETLRDLARRRPEEAEAYLDAHQDEWEEIAESTPENAADILEALGEEGAADLLRDLDPDDAGDVLDEMRPEAAADVLEMIRPSAAAAMISMMDADQAADVLVSWNRLNEPPCSPRSTRQQRPKSRTCSCMRPIPPAA